MPAKLARIPLARPSALPRLKPVFASTDRSYVGVRWRTRPLVLSTDPTGSAPTYLERSRLCALKFLLTVLLLLVWRSFLNAPAFSHFLVLNATYLGRSQFGRPWCVAYTPECKSRRAFDSILACSSANRSGS